MTQPRALSLAPSPPHKGGARRVSDMPKVPTLVRASSRPARVLLPEAIVSMARLLRQENEALLARDFGAAGALLAPKLAAADMLAAAWREATQLEESTEDLRKLGVLAEENKRLANQAMHVQRRVLDLVTRAARQSDRNTLETVRRRKPDSGA
jgi:hypothetical protein